MAKVTQEVVYTVLNRKPRMCNILEWKGKKLIYKRFELITYFQYFFNYFYISKKS